METQHKKKIVFAIHSLQVGGMERVMSVLASDFAVRKDVELHVILYGKNPEIFYPISDRITVHAPQLGFNQSRRILSTYKRLRFLRKKIKKIKPETVLSFGEIWNNFVLIATYSLGIPIFISDRNQPTKILTKTNTKIRSILYPKAKGIIVQTEIAKNIYLDKKLNKNIKVIGNPIEPMPIEKNSIKENNILMVSRLIETKHHDILIRVFSKIKDESWKLVLVGDDANLQKNRSKLEDLVKQYKIEGRVIFTGKQNNVARYYSTSKIFAFTSSSEGFPNVIGEAMSASLPVIAFDCIAGPSEMIKDGVNGFLIPLFDESSFEEKLEVLVDDDILREKFGIQAKKDILKFKSDEISEKFYQFICN